MKAILAALALVVVSLSSASAQAPVREIKCDPVQASPADGGYKLVEVRRPKVDAQFGVMSIQVAEDTSLARIDVPDTGNTPWVQTVSQCNAADTHYQVVYRVAVIHRDDFDVASIPLPETAKDVSIKSCSAKTKTCWTAVFNGDFTNPVVELKASTDDGTGRHNPADRKISEDRMKD
jgi:hypothetical protein